VQPALPALVSLLAESELPVGEIFVLAGFLLIYLVEEAGHWVLVRCRDNREQGS
jgi:hypothetical protein